VAKIAGIEMCWSYNRQYSTSFLAAMPTNLYGLNDRYDLHNSHVIPALIRKFHEARVRNDKQVIVWGTGNPRREFLYSDDMADACVYLMGLPNDVFGSLLAGAESIGRVLKPPLINIGVGEDITIGELAALVKKVIGYKGEIVFDPSKPDGTPRKLLDVSRLHALGWHASTSLWVGLTKTYEDFKSNHSAAQSN
jgi:GDP-L-fucose synthase